MATPGAPGYLAASRDGPRARSQADVAQLVEQLIRNQQVTGSNPVVGSMFSGCCAGQAAADRFLATRWQLLGS